MYIPSHFEENRSEELHRVIHENPLGALVLNGPSGLDANHLPFELNEKDGFVVLLAHVARSNPLWREAQDGDEVLVVFRGVDAYISPNWYPSKQELHNVVPTWNYQAVNVHGKIYIRDDEVFVRKLLARLTHTHESRLGQEQPWRMTDAPKAFMDQKIAAVVGIEIKVERMVGKWKLSQNRLDGDLLSAANELERRGDSDTAAAMRAARGPGS